MKYSFRKSVSVFTLLVLTFSAVGMQPARAAAVLPAGLTAADRAQITALLPAAAGDYLKASNTEAFDVFGGSIALDGDTLVVGAQNSISKPGAAYVFTRSGGAWSQQAYLIASNTGAGDRFGSSVAISGETIVVGAYGESSYSGAAYVFTRTGGVWSQQAYLKASNAEAGNEFGRSVAISGETIVVGAHFESSNATGVNGDESNDFAISAGAAYVFTRTGGVWSQQAYLKASNTDAGDQFGGSVAISGETIVVGAAGEDSKADGVNGDQSDNFAIQSGAAYVFTRSGGAWSQQAYLKAENPWINDYGVNDGFGNSVAISGETIVVGAYAEDSNATGVNGDGSDNSVPHSGAAYVFTRSGDAWSQQAYLKASNTGRLDLFGYSVAISGETIVVGAQGESSHATGVNGDGSDNSALSSGAAYVFSRSGGVWSHQAYLKASNTGAYDRFGFSVAVSGEAIVVGAPNESSNATGVNGDGSNDLALDSGAAYTFDIALPVVISIQRAGASPTASASVDFTVTFSEAVTGVGNNDFALTTTGVSGASLTGVSGAGASYTVSVNTGNGNGTIRLDVVDDDSIQDVANNPLGGLGSGNGDFTSGEVYVIQGFKPIGKWTSSFDLSHGWTVQGFVRTVGDVNGDGQDDLVGFGLDGVYVALSTGSGFGAIGKWTSAFDLGHGWTVQDFVRTVGDVNGDGRDDLVGFGLDGVYVALSTGNGFGSIGKWTSAFDLSHGWTVQNFVRTVGDVDADGDADLVGFGLDGVYVGLSDGSRFAAPGLWIARLGTSHGWTISNHVRMVGDVSGDGRADLVAFGQDGVYVSLSEGSSFAAPTRWSPSFANQYGWTVSNHVRTVGDVNGDGKDDIIGFGMDGVYVALSSGSGFGSISQWTSAFDLSHGWTVQDFVRTVGDVSGDGKADLVGFGLDGVYIATAR